MQTTSDDTFKSLYTAVITAAVYGCTWFGCFYWPSFLGYLIFPQQILQIEMIAGIIVLPLGLVTLGAFESLKMATLHLLLTILALGTGVGYLLATGRDSDLEFVRRLILLDLFAAYALAGIHSTFRRIKQHRQEAANV